MLIDLLDKKIRLENDYDALKGDIWHTSRHSGDADKTGVTLNALFDVINKIRSHELLIYSEKSKIKVKIDDQEFDLNEWDLLTVNIKRKVKVYDIMINEVAPDLNLVDLLNQRDTLQAELDQINKAIDSAMWRIELNDR